MYSDEERRHAVVGEALPGFGEGEIEQAAGMAHEGYVVGGRDRSGTSVDRLFQRR